MATETETILKKEQGNRLKEARNRLDLTQKELAEKIYHTWFQIKEMEFGRTKITLAIAKLLYYEVGINPDYILEGTGDMFVERIDGKSLDTDTQTIINELQKKPNLKSIIIKFILTSYGNKEAYTELQNIITGMGLLIK